VRLSLTQKMSTKYICKTRPKHCKTSAKHRKTLFFGKHSQNTAKHPQNTRKTPQNIAKHHKTDLLTKQTELANKPLRSQLLWMTYRPLFKNTRSSFTTACLPLGRPLEMPPWSLRAMLLLTRRAPRTPTSHFYVVTESAAANQVTLIN